MGFGDFLAQWQPDPAEGRTPGDVLSGAGMARSWWDAADAPEPADQDEAVANLLARGYTPGSVSMLAERLQDTEAELETELGKLERSARRQELAAREFAAGRVGAMGMQEILGDDAGDARRAEALERRAASLRGQLADASAMIAPPAEREPDAFQAASSRASDAHQQFVRETRAAMSAAEAGTWKRPTLRPADIARAVMPPFGSGGDGAAADCPDCQNLMRSATRPATAAEAAQVHAQVCEGKPTVTGDLAAYDAEVTRLTGLGYSLATAQTAATPADYR